MTLYQELKNEMLKSLLIEVNDETSYRVHQATFCFGLGNGLPNQESYWLANDIVNIAYGKTLDELKEIAKQNEPPKRIEWTIGNGKHRLVPTKESRKLIFRKIIDFIRNTNFFKIYTSVDVLSSHYEATEIRFHWRDSDFYNGECDIVFDYDQQEKVQGIVPGI